MDLTCTHNNVIGLVGSMYFLGWALFSTVIPGLADKYGRKWPFFWSCFL